MSKIISVQRRRQVVYSRWDAPSV